MAFYDDIKVLDMTLTKKEAKWKIIQYPSLQTVKILTVHLRRAIAPRQINITNGKELRTWMPRKHTHNWFFIRNLLNSSVRGVGVCPHCVLGAWAYIRVGAETHVLWMKGKNRDLSYVS